MGRMRDLGLAVTRFIAHNQLYAWIMAASAVLDSQGDALGPFNTIATGAAGSGRLIDVSVETLASLEAGAVCWVLSVKDWFRWDPTSTLAADNITVCRPPGIPGGAGAFIRECIPAPEWTQKPSFTAWVIDANNGSDENLGNAASPLKTDAERQRRWGKGAVLPDSFGAWSISFATVNGSADPFILDCVLEGAATLTLTSTRTIATTGTVTAFAAVNRATPEMPLVTDSNQTWTPQVQRWARINGGARVGTVFNIAKDNGSHVARVSTPVTVATAQRVTLQVGDPYEVETVPVITNGYIKVLRANTSGGFPTVTFQSFYLSGGTLTTQGVGVLSDRATFDGVSLYTDGQATLVACVLKNNVGISAGGPTSFYAGVSFGSVFINTGARADFDIDFLFQGGKLSMSVGARSVPSTLAFFDSPASGALEILPGASVRTNASIGDGGIDLIWGGNNTGFGVIVRSECALVYVTKPTVNTGLTPNRQSQIGGVSVDWTGVPTVTAANGAAIVLFA